MVHRDGAGVHAWLPYQVHTATAARCMLHPCLTVPRQLAALEPAAIDCVAPLALSAASI
jgi:hypothetical protein